METWSQGLVSECQHSFAQHKAEQGIGSTYKNHTTSAQGYQHFGFNSPGVCPASLHSTLLHLFFIFSPSLTPKPGISFPFGAPNVPRASQNMRTERLVGIKPHLGQPN